MSSREQTLRGQRSEPRLDESIFLGGLPKVEFLKAYDADVFFDDQETHCELAGSYVATGHVPHGVANEPTD